MASSEVDLKVAEAYYATRSLESASISKMVHELGAGENRVTGLETYALITLSDLLDFDTFTELLSFLSGGCVSCTCTTFMHRTGALRLAPEAAKTWTATYKSSARLLRQRDSFQPMS